jgi:DHA1 family multidrug resistance protein-like MFS transporter
MSDHLRDTVFGQIIRLLSGRTLLKFPDEQNPELSEAFIREGSRTDNKLKDDGEGNDQDVEHAVKAVDPAQLSSSEEQHSLHRDIANHDEKGREAVLVDWYDSKDQEVCSMFLSL